MKKSVSQRTFRGSHLLAIVIATLAALAGFYESLQKASLSPVIQTELEELSKNVVLCHEDLDCPLTMRCDTNNQCVIPIRRGLPCEPKDVCTEGLTCRDGKCQTPGLKEGDPCTRYHSGSCGYGLVCVYDRCRKQGKEGERCVPDTLDPSCSEGLFCNSRTWTCQKRAKVGEKCGFISIETGTIACEENAYCNLDRHVCIARKDKGEECTPIYDDICKDGLICVGWKCIDILDPRKQPGEECIEDHECDAGWCKPRPDDPFRNVCYPSQQGEACQRTRECAPGLYCIAPGPGRAGTCLPYEDQPTY